MYDEILRWFERLIKEEEFRDKRVLEVGSLDINGSVRPIAEKLQPKEYIGIDLVKGKNVDRVLPAEKIVETFGTLSFDVVISTETIEHIPDWRTSIKNMKEALKEEGYLYITTVGPKYNRHGPYPDCWRYIKTDLEEIFSDFEIIEIAQLRENGIGIKAKKPKNYISNDLSKILLLSSKTGERTDKPECWNST